MLYAAGKADWIAAGLPSSGVTAGKPRAADFCRRDVPRCRLEETVGELRRRIGDWELSVVIDNRGVVLGLVPAEALGGEAGRPVTEVMEEAPATCRPNVAASELRARLRRRDMRRILLTTSSGELVGLVRRAELDSGSSQALS